MTEELETNENVTSQPTEVLLTDLQKNYYQRDGFLVIKNFVPEDICRFLVQHAMDLISHFNSDESKLSFSTTTHEHANHDYFLGSGDKIRFFFEENVRDKHGNLVVDKQQAINKIGHALHDLDPVFNLFSRSHKIARLMNELEIHHPLLVQSMYICKQSFIGGEVTCHQDSTYLYTEGQPVTGLWFALEDATLENGCLWAIPGGHHSPVKSRMLRDENNKIATEFYDNSPWDLKKMIPLEVQRGSLIMLHGRLPHMSRENISSRSRHAYTLHIISGDSHYAENNWLQRASPFKGFNL